MRQGNAAQWTAAPRARGTRVFRKHFGWMLAANVIYAGCQWILLMLMTKRCSTEEVGLFALGLAVTAPVTMFAGLQLRAVQITDSCRRYEFHEYLTLRLITVGLGFAAIVALALPPSHGTGARLVIGLLGVSKSFESLSDILQGYMQQQERMTQVARSSILKGLLSVVFLYAVTLRRPSAAAAAAAVAAANLTSLAIYDWPMARKFGALPRLTMRAARARIWQLAVHALPLGAVQGLVSLSANVPRYYLERFSGPQDLGVFSALASLIVVGQTAVSALGQVASPRLARSFSHGDIPAFRSLLVRMIALGGALGIAMAGLASVAGYRILALLFRQEYAQRVDLLLILLTAGTVAYGAWLAGFGLTAAGAFKPQIPLMAAVCLAAWAGSTWWIPGYGSRGAAFALLFSMLVQLAGAILILMRCCAAQSRARIHSEAMPLERYEGSAPA